MNYDNKTYAPIAHNNMDIGQQDGYFSPSEEELYEAQVEYEQTIQAEMQAERKNANIIKLKSNKNPSVNCKSSRSFYAEFREKTLVKMPIDKLETA